MYIFNLISTFTIMSTKILKAETSKWLHFLY